MQNLLTVMFVTNGKRHNNTYCTMLFSFWESGQTRTTISNLSSWFENGPTLTRTHTLSNLAENRLRDWVFSYLPSWRSSEKRVARGMLSWSNALRPEYGPDENIEDVPSDSKVVDDCFWAARVFVVADVSWYSVTRCTIFSDCTTSPMVGRWFASGATQAAAIVQTRAKSSIGYFPPSFGSASSSRRSVSLRIGLDCITKIQSVMTSANFYQYA